MDARNLWMTMRPWAGLRVRGVGFTVLALALLAPGMLLAQLAWESPLMLRPGAPAGYSFVFIDYGLSPYTGLGGAIVWRAEPAPRGIGLRASAAQGMGDKLNFAGGVDMSGPLLRSSNGFPLELIWTSGAGASYGEYVEVGVPIGVAGGRSVSSESVWFNPYTSARAVLEGRLGEAAPEGSVRLGLVIDLGADLAFGRSRNFMVRMAVSLGDRHAAAIGVNLGGGGSVSSARVSPLQRQ